MVDKMKIIINNILRAEGAFLESFERLRPHIDDLCMMIHQYNYSEKENIYDLAEEIKSEIMPQDAGEELGLCIDFIFQCIYKTLCEKISNAEAGVKIDHSLKEGAKIVYVRNSYSDFCYNAFAALLSNPVSRYSDSFIAACEDVYYSRAEYCILPVSTSKEGILQSFRNMIDKYDLKIILKTNCYSGDDYTEFALLSKDEKIIKTPSGIFIEINITLPASQTIGKCLRMIEEEAVEVVRVDSIPLKYTGNRFSYNILMKNEKDNITEILGRLNLYFPGCQLNGIYSYILN